MEKTRPSDSRPTGPVTSEGDINGRVKCGPHENYEGDDADYTRADFRVNSFLD
jgi:hypothetical protein